MHLGVIFPQIEIGPDPTDVQAFARGVEAAGYDHLLVYDHVLGADLSKHPESPGFYGHTDQFHEPFVLFGYLAATTRLELVTGVLVLPQRQTALVAKQAAEVDVLSRGRLRLGVGVGWNTVEYEALGMDVSTRGRRLDEQVELMRRLWTEEVVDFEGRYHRVRAAGINPLPVQRPIPVWFGAFEDPRGLRRVGRLGDGWIPLLPPGERLDAAFAEVRRAAEAAGRDPDALGMQGRVLAPAPGDASDADRFRRHLDRWRRAGATHLAVDTMRLSIRNVEERLDVLHRAYELAED
jgi:probable F420-dependent oxidoreductase